MMFLIRAVLWVGCAWFAAGAARAPVWAGAALVVVGGALAAQRFGYSRVNRALILLDWLAITAAVRLAPPTSPAFVLYGLESVVLTVYGAVVWTLLAAILFSVSFIWARWPALTPRFGFELFLMNAALMSAGLTGAAFAHQQRVLAHQRRRLSELAGLRAIQESLLQEQPLDMLMAALLKQSLDMLALDIGYVAMVETGGWMRTAAAVGLNPGVVSWRWEAATAEPTRTVLQTRKPLIVADAEAIRVTGLDADGVRTLVVAPLMEGDKPVGVLGLGSRRRDAFGEDILPLVESLANLAAGQMRFDRERAAARARSRMIASLERVSRILNANLKMEALLPSLHAIVAEELQPDAFFVALLLPHDPEHAYVAYMYDEGKVYEPQLVELRPDGPTAQVMRDGEPRQFRGDVAGASTIGSQRAPVGWMVAPMKHEGRVIGAISAQSYRMLYSQEHLDFLSSVANQAAVAVENARLYQESEQAALTDHVTGLGNSRRFALELERAIQIAQADGSPLALLMIDSDSLKRINDQHGHRAGDEHIRQLATVIRENVRTNDVACRYAGDEFVVLLPHTPVEAARRVAERIRAAVAEGFMWEGQVRLDQSVSIGVAVYEPGMTAEQFFVAADRAMYRAKEGGRNRVAVTGGRAY
jgi:diguanylate cyclase (GGDEF)-like protein